MWERLVDVLANMLKLYQALLTISKQKHDILVGAKAQELDALTKQEELLIVQIGKLEVIREKYLQELITVHKFSDENITISKLTEVADQDIGGQITDLLKQFDRITAELVQMNKLNTKLIEQALSFINYNINLLTQNTIGPTYAAKGQQTQGATTRAVLDQKV
ncbi:hypothetical protein SPFL3102_01667 [Sporomusaceae bacterium FL31]|nr:hypothetical protein SPFL3101_03301 [Sporomusaceae bacterium FL31]GCE33858.1 hypothetical protein SPFL3102_01667 [Sporomusaceae bacterium]